MTSSTPTTVRAALAALAGAFLVLGLVEAMRDAPGVDEAVDVAAGVSALHERDLRMNPEHGALHHVAPAILPVLFADPVVPTGRSWSSGDWFDFTEDFLEANRAADRLDATVFWFRVVPLLSAVAGGLVLFSIARRLGGPIGGLLAAAAWFTIPYVRGLAHLSSLDVTFTVSLLVLLLAVVRDREGPALGSAAVVGVALGLVLATRHTGVVLAPVAVGAVAASRWRERSDLVPALAVVVLVPFVVVWSVYRAVDVSPVTGEPRARFDGVIAVAREAGPAERLVVSMPLPLEWRAGFGYLVATADERPAFFADRAWVGSKWWFFPASAFVKVPVLTTLGLVAGIAALWARRRDGPPPFAAGIVGLAGLVYGSFLLVQPHNLGLRLALPVLALTLVFVGAASQWVGSRPGRVAVAFGVGAQLTASIVSFPHSLAWTQPPFSDGYRWISDSSLDYGQASDVVIEAHEREPFVAVTLVTPRGTPTAPEGVPSLLEAAPSELVGRVAVGATALMVVHRDALSWLRAHCVHHTLAGGAVLVYEFETPPNTDPGPTRPTGSCGSGPSRRG